MSERDLLARPAADVAAEIARGALARTAALDASLDAAQRVRIGAEGLNAVLWRDDAAARDAANRAAAGALCGLPVPVKDNIATLGLPTTCGSRMLEGYVSPFEATAVARLRAAGAIVQMKTNMDEFAMGSSTEHSAWGRAQHPLDATRVPGGSSGGSAVVVAAGVSRIALGSETGGSVRQPAAFCGIVGVKPTYGRVSRHGLVAFASSLDHIGVFGQTVDDAALGLGVIAGVDPLDSTSVDTPVGDYRATRDADGPRPLDGVVVGWPREYFPDTLDPAMRALLERAADTLRALGAEIREVSLPHTALAIPVYYIVAPAEASSNLARFDGVRYGRRVDPGQGLRGMYETTRSEGFGAEVTRRILLGTYVLSAGYYDAYYKRAMAVRALIADDFRRVFASGVHVLFTPTTPTVAFEAGSKSDPYEMYLSDIFTVTANLAGIPAMSQPIGRIDGLPAGGQLMASHFDEATMFRVAYALERALGAEAHR
ncbi:MAG: Asp-tRNA(Asn)/Glu-tRNA(Gln) amidotransferase subunit GatA [Gemmatimonadaceae bacterium]|jgi:aspartyl-tRNA(Asn)/glutamyl-tRNA(Gln) amidotransferase subunit A|nr:Asp-tRNA(Asn)/Glu-tRNA(Gln) amidotransferase subunit GatA [Gemmatimonadaceae bacterium]